MTKPPPASPASEENPPLPSQGVRTVASLLIFFHLFAVLVAVLSNTPGSQLMSQIRSVPVAKHLELLFMDDNFRYPLTQGNEMYWAAWLEADLKRDAETVAETVVFPPEGISPPVRKKRYDRLMFNTQMLARLAQQDETSPLVANGREQFLPRAIAGALMREEGYELANVRVRSRSLQLMGDMEHPTWGDPYYEEYLQTILRGDAGIDEQGNAFFLKREDDRRNAPALSENPRADSSNESDQ